MLKNILVPILISLVVSLGASAVYLSGHGATNFAGTTHLSGLTLEGLGTDDGLIINAGVATSTIGASATVTYWSIGGINYAYSRVPMTATSSVVCAMPNPFGTATSTAIGPMLIQVTANGIAQNQNLFVSTSTTNAASSTNAWSGALALAASTQATFTFRGNFATTSVSTSPSGTGDTNILPGLLTSGVTTRFLGPSEFLNVKIGTSTAGTYASYLTGTCAQQFQKP